MTKSKARSAGVAGMLFLIALAAVGILMGLGSGSLSFDTSVAQTTDMHADWECSWTNDDGVTTGSDFCGGLGAEAAGDDGLDPWGSFAPFPYHPDLGSHEKDVGECVASIPVPDPNDDAQVATVTIGNAYPSYECTFTLVISNSGSVPFTIAGFNTDDLDPPLELLDGTCTATEEDSGTSTSGEVVLDVLEKGSIECTIHVMQEALQEHTYAFTISACSAACGARVDNGPFGILGLLGVGREAPASIGISVASETR